MSDDETRPVRELLDTPVAHVMERYVVHPGDLEYARLSWSDLRQPEHLYGEGGVEVVTVPYTCWGDYSGSTCERSNYRVLLEDWAEHVIDVYGGFGAHGVVMRLDADIPEVLFDEIVGLADYPVLDEEDMSLLELDLEVEDWESWAEADFQRDLEDAFSEEEWEEAEVVVDCMTWRTVFFDASSESGHYWEAETAVSGYWPEWQAIVDRAAWIIRQRLEQDRTLTWPIPGQGVLL